MYLVFKEDIMFKLPDLPYRYDALEPYIYTVTMQVHHDKHHQAYVDKLNAAIENDTSLKDKSVEDILSNIKAINNDIKTAVVNNGGGHFNHSFFWKSMSPDFSFDPKSKIGQEIIKTFGDFESFKEKFSNVALGRFGSGWVWLVVDNGKLEIIDTQNQDSPISVSKTPIICLDVWEHAYYLKYQNKRADYVKAWWSVVNWDQAEKNFIELIK
jgi:Fe-Mn family superoxide dismutase